MKTYSYTIIIILIAAGLTVLFYLYESKTNSKNDGKEENTSRSSIEPENVVLNDVSSGEGYGSAKRIFSGGQFILIVEAKLPVLESPQYYAAWLSNNDVINSLGKLNPRDNDYYLEYRSNQNQFDSNSVVISEENVDNPAVPAKHILEGNFKDVQ